jgi:hypothetical protein
MEVTNAGRAGQGKWVVSQHGRENLELAILVAALCRRKSTEDSSEMVCKWGRDCAGRGSQSLSNKRGATNMPGGRDRSQQCVRSGPLLGAGCRCVI